MWEITFNFLTAITPLITAIGVSISAVIAAWMYRREKEREKPGFDIKQEIYNHIREVIYNRISATNNSKDYTLFIISVEILPKYFFRKIPKDVGLTNNQNISNNITNKYSKVSINKKVTPDKRANLSFITLAGEKCEGGFVKYRINYSYQSPKIKVQHVDLIRALPKISSQNE